VSRNERIVHATPQQIFDVLADPRGYAYWVIGSIEIRDADADWPRKGSKFHHTVGAGPLRLKDHTVVEEVEPQRFLQIQAKTRPFGKSRVKLELEPVDGGSKVTMIEDPADTATAFLYQPLTHLLMRGRNLKSLERLAELAEGRRPMPGEEPGAPVRTVQGPGAVLNPEIAERRRNGGALSALTRRLRLRR
jgi:uncharacterized protein YndB with AHSA1/START domain